MTRTTKTWWWADGDTGEVWPCEVLGPSVWPQYVRIRLTHPRHGGKELTTARRAVYDSQFIHPVAEGAS